MDWWIWVVVGFVLLLFELVSPGGFYLFFFGAGALVVGLLAGLGWAGPAWLQGVLFAAVSFLSLLVFRPVLIKKMQADTPNMEVDSLLGERAVARDEIPPDGMGKAELRGTTWNARNAGTTPIVASQSCRVDKVDGLVLWIRAD